MPLNAGGSDGFSSNGDVGAVFNCACRTVYEESAWKGFRPVRISYSVTPKE